MNYFAHETAVIDENCTIGEGTKIWHFSHVMSNCVLGKNCNLGQNVVISPDVILGENVKVQNNISIYTGVVCEDDVFLGPSMVFTNVTNPRSGSGHIESVHSYTNDQNLIDNFHKKERRGRSAALNMVITETGAGKAVGQVLPELMGKLTANAVRVPTPNVSLAIMNLQLGREITLEELNDFLRQKAFHSDLKEQIGFTNSPEVVSTDFVGDRHAGIIDSAATIVNGDKCVLYVWYDNEYGYTAQLLGLAKEMVGLTYVRYPNFTESS
jgi:glyceraldehyde 3-phosphate dehydrogenase